MNVKIKLRMTALQLGIRHSANKPEASSRLQRWALTLAGYDYVIRHRSGEAHENCDALSRLPLPTESTKTPAQAEYVQLIQMLDDSPITSGTFETGLSVTLYYRVFKDMF